MKLGLIARFDHRGLGQQTRSVFNALHPFKTLVVNCPSAKPLPPHPEYFPGATVIDRLPTDQDVEQFIDGCTVIYSAETFYNRNFTAIADRMGVKTVLHVNPEFMDLHDSPALWAAPSVWRWDTIPANKILLPVPIEAVVTRPVSNVARHYLHVVGRPATRDRNGTEALLAALQYVTSTIRLTVTCQEAGYVEGIADGVCVPPNVELVIRSGDVPESTDLYRGMDVLVLPRRFGGLCLPQQEALGHGMPVVMSNISPNDHRLPSDWLVGASHAGSFTVNQNVIDYYSVDPRALAQLLDRFATDTEFYTKAVRQARELADSQSWENMRGIYLSTFEELA